MNSAAIDLPQVVVITGLYSGIEDQATEADPEFEFNPIFDYIHTNLGNIAECLAPCAFLRGCVNRRCQSRW